MGTHHQRQSGTRLKRIVAAVAVVAGLGLIAPAVLTVLPARASSLPVMYDLSGWRNGQVRPYAVYIGAGGSLFMRPIYWRYWTMTSAHGHGTRWANNCIPNCAQGSYRKSRASITMWRARWHNHRRYFSRMTWRWTTRSGVHRQYVYRWGNPYGGTVPLWY